MRTFRLLLALLLALAATVQSTTIHVPVDQPTIQAGIDAASNGDTVLVAGGTYTGEGNHVIRFYGKRITLASENGPEYTTLKGHSHWPFGIRCFAVCDGEDSMTIIDGFTVTEWRVLEGGSGGAGACVSNSSPVFKNCVFSNNWACDNGIMTGGGIEFHNSQAKLINCTVVNNHADCGSAFYSYQSSIQLHNCIIAFNSGTEPGCVNPWGSDSALMPRLYCCNAYGNQNTVWDDPSGSENGLSVNPMFCDSSISDFSLRDDSPCLPGNNEYGILIGALGEGCTISDVEIETFSDCLPDDYELLQNYPNPFNPTTVIEYELPHRSRIQVVVCNLLGQWVTTLVDEWRHSGWHSVVWDGTDYSGQQVASGIYFYRIVADDYKASKKMILLK